MVPLCNCLSFSHKTIFGYIHISQLKRVISLDGVWRQKFKSPHWHDFDLSHTWKQRLVLCSGVTAHQQSSVWARAGKSMFCIHGVVNDSRLVLFSKSSFPHIFFFLRVDKGEAVMAQREGTEAPAACLSLEVLFLTQTAFEDRLDNVTSLEMLHQTERFAKQTIALVCRSMRKLTMMSDHTVEQRHSDHGRIYQSTCPCRCLPARWAHELFEALLNTKL